MKIVLTDLKEGIFEQACKVLGYDPNNDVVDNIIIAVLKTPPEIPDDIDPEYEAMKADLT